MRTKKGFTLIELIIVIAIFGILLAVLIPSWGYYLQRSRTRAQNNKAKAIFNAAQTAVVDLEFSERRYLNVYTKPGATATEKNTALKHLYSHIPGKGDEWYYFWDGTSGYRCDSAGDALTADSAGYTEAEFNALPLAEWNEKIGNEISKIVDDNITYKIYIKDYKVQSVVSSRFARDRFLGSYPKNVEKAATDESVSEDDIRDARVKGADMELFNLD